MGLKMFMLNDHPFTFQKTVEKFESFKAILEQSIKQCQELLSELLEFKLTVEKQYARLLQELRESGIAGMM